jgi:glycerophosphoryl diester phosphodiesterase
MGRRAAAQGPPLRAARHHAARSVAQLTLALAALLALAAPASAQNPWLRERVMNIGHQGGERELPSNTMYAFRQAVRRGADMLEIDVNPTSDDSLVVMHDWTLDRTTNGTGYVSDLPLSQVQALDAAFDFVPGRNAVSGLPASRYPFRGVRTGDKRPPRGFTASDFRVPTLREVLRAFPHTPINIEIKGRDDDPAQFLRGAELLAAELRGTRRRDLIVVSFNQAAVNRFHELVPSVPVAPGVDGIAGFLLGGSSPGDGVVALQIPITFRLGEEVVDVTTPESVLAAHRAGFAVHVWLSGGEESRRVYERLLDMCVDGIMAAAPQALERVLRARDVVRPDGRGVDPCGARAIGGSLESAGLLVDLQRRGLGPQEHRGTVTVRSRAGVVLARGRFRMREGRDVAEPLLRYTRAARSERGGGGSPSRPRSVPAVAEVRVRGARGEPLRSRIRLRPVVYTGAPGS